MENILGLYAVNFIQILGIMGVFSLVDGGLNFVLTRTNKNKFAKNIDDLKTIKTISVPTECSIDDLKPLIKIMEHQFVLSDLGTMYKHLGNIDYRIKDKKLSSVGGAYNSKDNIMVINNYGTLEHEFSHMCSSDYEDGISQNGFEIVTKKNKKFGYGLNEGYTELFANRHFHAIPNNVYKKSTNIAHIIEKLFTYPREMEELYLNHNLKGLIKKMTEYMSLDEAITLLNKIDEAHRFAVGGNFFATSTYAEIEAELLPYIKHKNCNEYLSILTKIYTKIKSR